MVFLPGGRLFLSYFTVRGPRHIVLDTHPKKCAHFEVEEMLKRLVCGPPNIHCAGFPGGSVVKNPPPAQGTWVQSLILEDPLEKETATHSSTLAWRFSWTEGPGRLQSMGSQESDTS